MDKPTKIFLIIFGVIILSSAIFLILTIPKEEIWFYSIIVFEEGKPIDAISSTCKLIGSNKENIYNEVVYFIRKQHNISEDKKIIIRCLTKMSG